MAVGVGVVPQVQVKLVLSHLGRKLQVAVLVVPLELDVPALGNWLHRLFGHNERISHLELQQLVQAVVQQSRLLVDDAGVVAMGVGLFDLLVY